MLSIEDCVSSADTIRSLGYNPIASCPVHNHPCYGYKQDKQEGQPKSKFDSLAKRAMPCGEKQTNIQVATGLAWKLVVLDLDGPSSLAIWKYWLALDGRIDLLTWVVQTPRGGQQWWFHCEESVPYSIIWKDEEGGHSLIEVLGEDRLAKIPPSVKEVNGEFVPYKWVVGPEDTPRPAQMPSWLISKAMSSFAAKKPEKPALLVRKEGPMKTSNFRYEWRSVLDAIPSSERLSLAMSWGLKTATSTANSSGFVKCHSFCREDSNPSAYLNLNTGYYSDFGSEGHRLTLFELGAALGVYASWMDAVNDLGHVYNAVGANA
jgi:hypothetical protein